MLRDTQIIQDFFNNHARHFGDSAQALGWESDYTQKMRFWALCEIAPLNGMRVLDVGCGKADLYSYFIEEGISVEYYGVEFSDELIKLGRKNHRDIQIFYRDFLKDAHYPEVDYTIGSGIANVCTPNNQEYLEAIIKKMFSLAGKGTAVNMLSTYTPKKKCDKNMYLYSPEYMLKFAFKLTPHVILRHDYLPNDFTLYLYKD